MKRFTYFFLLFLSLSIMSFSIETIDIQDINLIKIKAEFIDLHIDSYDGDKILIKQLSGDKDDKDIDISSFVDNKTLNINLLNQKKYTFYRSKIKIKILVPSGLILQYNINSKNSSLDIQNISGNIISDNKDTGISFEHIKGNLDLKTSNKVMYLANIIGDINLKGTTSKIITKNTDGILNIITNNKRIDIQNASIINNISTSDASIYADFKEITDTAKVVTNDHSITITIPKKHQYSFSIFGDLIKVINNFDKQDLDNNSDNDDSGDKQKNKDFDKFLILGTSNAKIRIKNRD